MFPTCPKELQGFMQEILLNLRKDNTNIHYGSFMYLYDFDFNTFLFEISGVEGFFADTASYIIHHTAPVDCFSAKMCHI